ncbi:hypothetical protein CVM73_23920 [Bradyrhizobium forestalis]|uniref:DUF4062 domain-containing protein n=1 Tax=Bradyrhizobium forestalis TaxID=1419263 RepID=A0A2M8R509_9BRAD|nr:hypothetical protein [Bradyrhizobium forestalis]PJG52902.1 hypothetical protein CVM73_23920 [Bradyrhizobium forestalis]
MPRKIKIFLSSPSDVSTEQQMVVALAKEINDVIAFLAPQLDVRLVVLRYQDDVFPDAGEPQEVVDRQMPQDYDIHLGIMWMRCGTKTASAPSGTIHEFRQAMKRREATGRPIIMFYFSDERPAALARTHEELDQMGAVIDFREELAQIGLTMVYPDRASFRERVRGGLLRAVSDLLNRAPQVQTATLSKEAPVTEVPAAIANLAREYDEVRATMDSGGARTQRMTDIAGRMVAEAPAAIRVLDLLKASGSAGGRLAAIAALRAFPQEDQLDWLADRLHPQREKPFIGYQAAISLAQAVRSLPKSADGKLKTAITDATKFAKLNPSDAPRIRVLEQAQRELQMRQKS